MPMQQALSQALTLSHCSVEEEPKGSRSNSRSFQPLMRGLTVEDLSWCFSEHQDGRVNSVRLVHRCLGDVRSASA
jgi:hypothetical protein